MRKVKCGMDGAEICCGMVCKVRNASLEFAGLSWKFIEVIKLIELINTSFYITKRYF